jgi:hypothetical protein
MGRSQKVSAKGNAVVVDDSLYPFAIATWFGQPDEELINFYFDWQEQRLIRARDEGIQVATIIDATDGDRPPSTVRHVLAERSKVILGEFDPYIVYSWVVLTNALVRGVITAIKWMTPMRTIAAASMKEALVEGARALEKAGIEPPVGFDPDAYERPPRPNGDTDGLNQRAG